MLVDLRVFIKIPLSLFLVWSVKQLISDFLALSFVKSDDFVKKEKNFLIEKSDKLIGLEIFLVAAYFLFIFQERA